MARHASDSRAGGVSRPGVQQQVTRVPMDWLTRIRQPDIKEFARRWLIIFGGSLVLFIIRLLVPSPVGMADNGDGPRLMCGVGVVPVTGGHLRYDAYAYFAFRPSSVCANAGIYSSSAHPLLVLARWLTPLLGLSGTVNLIALGLITCLLQSAGIASLACALPLRLRTCILLAAALWLVVADAAFFDTYASPYSEGAMLTGLLLVAAGVLYLGRGPLALALGLVLGGAGGYLAIMSKEQYLPLAVPICVTLVLASASRSGRGFRRFLTARTGAAAVVAGYLLIATIAYAHQDATSPYANILHQEQAVNVIFENIVTQDDSAAVASLRALGLPVSWAQYAGDGFWAPHTVYHDPLYNRFANRLTDANLAQFLLTHPASLITIGQRAADGALIFRVNGLGTYSPSAGQPPGALEGRVTVLASIVGAIPTGLGLLWLLPLWAAMAAIAIRSLYRGRSLTGWHRDSAYAVLLLIGSAVAAFVPAAYFAGYETRHMLGTNLATALAFIISAILVCSMIRHSIADSSAAVEPEEDTALPLAVAVPAPSS